MTRLLGFATRLCGEHLGRSTFEPLLADWQRELDAARSHGHWRLTVVALSGATAYLLSLARCTMTGPGWLPAPRAAAVAFLTFFVAAKAAFVALWLLSLPRGFTADIGSVQAQSFLLSAAGILVAPVMLPVLFVLRRDTQSTARQAIAVIAAGAALTAGIVALTTPERLNQYFTTFEWVEREYQRALANDRAGRVTYPGTARRELRGPTTIEERRAGYERFMTWSAEQEARQPPLTTMQRLRRLQPVALAVVFGVMGWTLAGLGPITLSRAAMWWALMFVAMLSFGGMPGTLSGISMPILPHTYALPLFGAITAALVVASWRQAPAPSAPQAPQAP